METAKKFFTEVATNEALAKQLEESANKEEFLKIAENHGFNLTESDIGALKNITTTFEKQKSGESLSEDELELVSGGVFEEAGAWVDQAAVDAANWTDGAAREVDRFARRVFWNVFG